MNTQKHLCTKHVITLCAESKEIVLKVKAEIRRQCTISDAINKIIMERKK